MLPTESLSGNSIGEGLCGVVAGLTEVPHKEADVGTERLFIFALQVSEKKDYGANFFLLPFYIDWIAPLFKISMNFSAHYCNLASFLN